MTAPQTEAGPATEQWEPYAELEKEQKDMQQAPPEEDLTVKLRSALTPGCHFPYYPEK